MHEKTQEYKKVSHDGTSKEIRGDIKIPHSRMTKTCWETFVTFL